MTEYIKTAVHDDMDAAIWEGVKYFLIISVTSRIWMIKIWCSAENYHLAVNWTGNCFIYWFSLRLSL